MRFWPDDLTRTVRVTYYFTDGKPLGLVTPFCSQRWNSWDKLPRLGEVPGTETYYGGVPLAVPSGGLCGTAEEWLNGVDLNRAPLAINPVTGEAVCCARGVMALATLGIFADAFVGATGVYHLTGSARSSLTRSSSSSAAFMLSGTAISTFTRGSVAVATFLLSSSARANFSLNPVAVGSLLLSGLAASSVKRASAGNALFTQGGTAVSSFRPGSVGIGTFVISASAASSVKRASAGNALFTQGGTAVSSFSKTPVVHTFGTAGAGTDTVPAGYTHAKYEAWAAGGLSPATGGAAAGGAGGGAYARVNSVSVTGGSFINYQVGNGGSPTAGDHDAWVGSSSTCFAKGAANVTGSSGTSGGAAASSIGDVVFSGGNGANASGGTGGGGGGGAGDANNGGNAAGAVAGVGGATGGGTGGNGAAGVNPGTAGHQAGGGAGGNGGTGLLPSHNGDNGKIRITYT